MQILWEKLFWREGWLLASEASALRLLWGEDIKIWHEHLSTVGGKRRTAFFRGKDGNGRGLTTAKRATHHPDSQGERRRCHPRNGPESWRLDKHAMSRKSIPRVGRRDSTVSLFLPVASGSPTPIKETDWPRREGYDIRKGRRGNRRRRQRATMPNAVWRLPAVAATTISKEQRSEWKERHRGDCGTSCNLLSGDLLPPGSACNGPPAVLFAPSHLPSSSQRDLFPGSL